MKLAYNNESLSSLKDEERVRQRPGLSFGTNDIHGCSHAIFEIIANSIDESRAGFGNEIYVQIDKNNIITVKDNGRGVPMDWNESEKKYNWELVYCTLYASGKYSADYYDDSTGLNGIGATATQYASEFMHVESVRDGKRYTMDFEKGRPVSSLKIEDVDDEPSGTLTIFRPDREVFSATEVPLEDYIDRLRRQAMLHSNIKFVIKYHDSKEIIIHYPGGTKDFLELICTKPMIQNVITFNGEDTGYEDDDSEPYTVKMNLALTFSRETSFIEMYHNSSYLSEGGSSYDALCYGITRVIEEYAKSTGKLGKSDKIQFKDVEELLVLIGYTDCAANRTLYKHQTKVAITNIFIRKAYLNFIVHNMNRWMYDNKASADRIVAEVLANKDAREQADAVKRKVIRKLSTSVETYQGRPDNFLGCSSNNPEDIELYIVEGLSAKGACGDARNSKFQEIMPIRGKIMNCLKEDLTRILNSEIIVDLLRVMGCGIEAESKYVKDLPKFDISKLRCGKVIICTDADLDGMQIRCLILTMIYRLMPTLLREGKVFIAETPLFEITAKGQTYFAYNDIEKARIMKELRESGIKDTQIKVQRSKGLGENDPEMMAVSTMNPETRKLIKVEYPEDERSVNTLFSALLGTDIESRRLMIEQYFDVQVEID